MFDPLTVNRLCTSTSREPPVTSSYTTLLPSTILKRRPPPQEDRSLGVYVTDDRTPVISYPALCTCRGTGPGDGETRLTDGVTEEGRKGRVWVGRWRHLRGVRMGVSV